MPVSLAPRPNDDEIECPRCGRIVYYEIARCPQCGLNLLEPDDEPDPEPPPGPSLWSRLVMQVRVWLNLPLPAQDFQAGLEAQAQLYKSLILKVGGDVPAAQRLIEFERARQPHANRTVWLKAALARWERDNRV